MSLHNSRASQAISAKSSVLTYDTPEHILSKLEFENLKEKKKILVSALIYNISIMLNGTFILCSQGQINFILLFNHIKTVR